MRARTSLLLLVVPFLLPLTALGQECGTIETDLSVLTIGDAPGPGSLTIERCYGLGWPGEILRPDRLILFPEFTAEWADTAYRAGNPHPEIRTTVILPGGVYALGSEGSYEVPADVTLIYTGSVEIYGKDVRIYGTVRTDSPNAGIKFALSGSFLIDGAEPNPAVIETRGENSPIEIGAEGGVTGSYQSQIIAEHGDVLISSGEAAPLTGLNLTYTDVRARDGALTISSVNRVVIQEGYFEGLGGGIKIRSRDKRMVLTDLVMDAGTTGPGIDIQGTSSISINGRADLTSGSGPIVITAADSHIIFDGVYSIYTGSGAQEYRATDLDFLNGSYLSSNTGDIFLFTRGASELRAASVVSSEGGDIIVIARAALTLSDGSMIHSGRGATQIHTESFGLFDDSRIGRGSFSYGPIHIRCSSASTSLVSAQSHIHGSTVEIHLKDPDPTDLFHSTADFGPCLVRAESGDLVIHSEGPIKCSGSLQARGDIRLDSEESFDLTDAVIRTDDRTEGTSGSIRIRSWAGSSAVIDLTGADVTTGDAPTASGDIEVLVGELEAFEPTTAFILPRRVLVSMNDENPSRSRIVVSGYCDLGLGAADLTAAASLEVGGLDVAVPGMVAKGKKFSHRDGSLKLTITPSKTGSSAAKFKMTYTGDLTGLVDPAGDLTLRLSGIGVDGSGTVSLTKGKYALKKVRGTLVEPGLYLAKAKAAVRGAGKDKLSLLLGLATDGSTPAAASDLSIGFGKAVSVTIPAASFTKNGDRYEFRGDIDGITSVVLDYAKETVKIKGKGMDLGTIPEGASEVDVSVTLGDDARAVRVRMVRSGSSLRY